MRCNKCVGLIRTKDMAQFSDRKLVRIVLRCECGNQEVIELEKIPTVKQSIKIKK